MEPKSASASGAQTEQPISLSLTHESMYVSSFGTGSSRERVSYRRNADWLQVHANKSRLSCATDTSHTTAFEISSNICTKNRSAVYCRGPKQET